MVPSALSQQCIFFLGNNLRVACLFEMFFVTVVTSVTCKILFQMTSSTPFGLHAGYKNETLRLWQSSGCEIHPHNLMLPLFITDESPDAK